MRRPRQAEQKTESLTWNPAIVTIMVKMPKVTTRAVLVVSLVSDMIKTAPMEVRTQIMPEYYGLKQSLLKAA